MAKKIEYLKKGRPFDKPAIIELITIMSLTVFVITSSIIFYLRIDELAELRDTQQIGLVAKYSILVISLISIILAAALVFFIIRGRRRSFEKLMDTQKNIDEKIFRKIKDLRKANKKLTAEVEDRKGLEEALRSIQQRLRAILDSTYELVGLLSKEGTVLDVNKKALTTVGVNKMEVLGLKFWETPWVTDDDKIQKRMQTIIKRAARGNFIRFETELKTKDGSTKGIDFIITPIKNEKGEVILLVPEGHDITELKKAEYELKKTKAEAENANNAKSDFLARMSHELRTPLNGILGYVQILLRNENLTKGDGKGLKVIKSSGEHLLDLINDILNLSKIEAGKFEILPDDFDLDHVLKSVVDLIKVRADQKSIGFVFNFDDQLPRHVFGDARLIKQILLNILGNAVKFTEQGKVELNVDLVENKVQFQIIDTGVGIHEDLLSKIFEPFEQTGDKAQKEQGTGLGLSISKKIIELMNGELKVESKLGTGSKFTILLNLTEVQEVSKSNIISSSLITGYKGKRIKILVGEDNANNIEVVKSILEPLGFELIIAVNGKEVLSKTIELNPDIILMDMIMPVMDGFQATKEIRKNYSNEVPIIAISASVLKKEQQLCFEAGCNYFLPKPINYDDLLETISKFLKVEWIYKETIVEKIPLVKDGEIVFPNGEILRRIYHESLKGNFTGIEALMSSVKKNDNFVIFCNKVEEFIKNYNEDGLINFLESSENWRKE